MAGFEAPLVVELANGFWVLQKPLVWRGSNGDVLAVETGEVTDFASTPRLLQAALPSAEPRVVRAAVVHDFLCRQLNERYAKVANRINDGYTHEAAENSAPPTKFSAVDADGVFRKIMKDEGASWLMQQVGWVGVRWGAAKNPARRAGWWGTFPELAWKTALLALPLMAPLVILVLLVIL